VSTQRLSPKLKLVLSKRAIKNNIVPYSQKNDFYVSILLICHSIQNIRQNLMLFRQNFNYDF